MTRIAVIEDDPALNQLMTEVLEFVGHTVMILSRSEGALDAIRSAQPDLVVLDLWLEEPESGWRLLQSLRGDSQTERIPVIICSADLTALRAKAPSLQEATIPVLTKPFDLGEMLALIESCLVERGAQLPAMGA